MAEEQHRWLDHDTAERLLRGEPLDTVDITVRDQAERLAKALGALSAESSPLPPAVRAFQDRAAFSASPPASACPVEADEALPGEAAALAAFRKAHAERADERAAEGTDAFGAALAAHSRPRSAVSDDVGLVRVGTHARGGTGGRSRHAGPGRRRRPVRLALSAALAVGAVGGVAAAATTGVLPTPFGGDEPAPGTSVSVPATPEHPLVTPSPDRTTGGGPGTPTPGGATTGAADRDAGSSALEGGAAPGHEATATAGSGDDQGAPESWNRLVSSCRDLRDGKSLDSDRRRDLETAAGGSARVWSYCRGVLKTVDGRSGDKGRDDQGGSEGGGENGKGGGKNRGGQGDQGSQDGQGDDQGGDRAGDGDGGKDGFGGNGRGLRKGLAPTMFAPPLPDVSPSGPEGLSDPSDPEWLSDPERPASLSAPFAGPHLRPLLIPPLPQL
ncbi:MULTISPECIES: extensin [unclassified Streptomyces]|uniref:extensin n=1 Tax=unclassified Streptomyces TaxID=2593676 RepID=UPI002DD909DB|nr:extensin [Streptomyces sp. NBC_01788]WSB28353.1 extensin [Streptomyces sp. NBC_01788]